MASNVDRSLTFRIFSSVDVVIIEGSDFFVLLDSKTKDETPRIKITATITATTAVFLLLTFLDSTFSMWFPSIYLSFGEVQNHSLIFLQRKDLFLFGIKLILRQNALIDKLLQFTQRFDFLVI